MSDTKEFHIGDILSVTTGRLLSKNGMAGIYDIMDFLAGGKGISTIGLLTFKDFATDTLLDQFPKLAGLEVPETVNSRETADAFLTEMEVRFGAVHTVTCGKLAHSESPGLESDLEALNRLNPRAKAIVIGV